MIFLICREHSIKVFSLILLLIVSLSLQAQTPDMPISIHLKEGSLKDFTAKIEKASGYSFIYGEEVKLEHPITLHLKNTPLKKVLQQAFSGQNISFRFTVSHILLHKEKAQTVQRRHTLNGYVLDQASKESLIGANIYDRLNEMGTTTNPFGHFSITLPEGDTKLDFSYIGYASQQVSLHLCKDTLLTIQLKNDNQLEEVVILSDKPETGIQSSRMGASSIPLTHIKNSPALLSEADVLKSIQLLPGVQTGMSGTSGLHVRGGGPDQNLYLLDGVPLYNVDHTLGLLSVFTPEAVKKVDLYKSSFPARFGGRLSSVIDVRTNDGDMRHYHGSFTIGLLTSHLHFEGPIWKDRTSFIVSARRSYIDWLTKPFQAKDEKLGYTLYDINAKLNHRFNDKYRFYLSFYKGKDHLFYNYDYIESEGEEIGDKNKQKLDWGNTLLTARLNLLFNPKLFNNTTIAYNNYEALSDTKYTNITTSNQINNIRSIARSGIQDWIIASDFDFHPSPAHRIKFGGQYIYHTFKPEVQNVHINDELPGQSQDTTYHVSPSAIRAGEAMIYGEDNFNLGEQWEINAGAQLSLLHVQKKAYLSFQPRLSLSYKWNQDFRLKASYNRSSQYVQLLSSSVISMPTDLWVPVTKHIKPMHADQYSAGIYYTGVKGWELSIETYYKYIRNALEYKDGYGFLGNSTHWEEKVEMGKGEAYGMEVMAQKTTGRLTGWISYTWAKANRQFPSGSINGGRKFPYKYDRRHTVNIALNYQLTRRIDLHAAWTYMSGNVATLPVGQTQFISPTGNTYYYGSGVYNTDQLNRPKIENGSWYKDRNNYRLPSTHRLNIGANFHKKTKHGERIWNVSLYNAYNQMNPDNLFIKYVDGEDGNGYRIHKPVLMKRTILPILPSFSYTYKF